MARTTSATDMSRDPLRLALAQCWRGLWLAAGFGLVINLLFLAVPLYLIQICDRVLASQRVETLLMLTVMAAFALLILGVLEVVRGRVLLRIGSWLERALSADVIQASVRAALAGADVNAQALRDAYTLRQFLAGGVRALLDLPWMPLFLVAVWFLHPMLGWLGLGTAVALFVLPALGQFFTQRAARQATAARLANEAFAEQATRNADVVQAMGMLPRFLDLWTETQASAQTFSRRAGDTNALLVGLTRFARLLAQIAVLGLGAYLVIQGELTAGTMIAASILMGRALLPLENSVAAWNDLIASRNAYTRLATLFARLPSRHESMPVVRPRAELSAQGLWCASAGGRAPILQAVSFELGASEAMAIVGPSASGKSTLCRLLVGAWTPTKGNVRLGGTDIHAEWPPEQLGDCVGYVQQHVEFFTATVQANIARLADRPDPETVVAAAEAAGVHEMILALPQGYDTTIGPGGHALSAGQMQRLALARALYGQPALIVLDEPDANLDGAGQNALQSALNAARQWQAAVVLVTHNPGLLKLTDHILVLDRGRVRFWGSRDDVLRRLLPARSSEALKAVRRGDPSPGRLGAATPLPGNRNAALGTG